ARLEVAVLEIAVSARSDRCEDQQGRAGTRRHDQPQGNASHALNHTLSSHSRLSSAIVTRGAPVVKAGGYALRSSAAWRSRTWSRIVSSILPEARTCSRARRRAPWALRAAIASRIARC